MSWRRIFRRDEDDARYEILRGSSERPFDIVAEGLEAWNRGDARQAEELLRQGIESYRRNEPDGVDFALGRYGAFLLDQERPAEAEDVLREAVARGTDIPAIWGDYMRIQFQRRDLTTLIQTARNMLTQVRATEDISASLLHFARKAQREGDDKFAESLARQVVEDASLGGHAGSRWAAIGGLGQILEKSGRADEAMELWTSAFAEGSNDPTTADRLSMHLERRKQYQEAAKVIREALGRSLTANVEERIRKRLLKCETKLGTTSDPRKKVDVLAFSLRQGEDRFKLVYQARVKPSIKGFNLIGDIARGLCSTKGKTTLVDIDAHTGEEVRRMDRLPELKGIAFSKLGWGMGWWRDAPIGGGPTTLWFLDESLEIVGEASIPDAVSEAALSSDLAYVGCRNGWLYVFDRQGSPLWSWETPLTEDPGTVAEPSFHPCPHYVSTAPNYVVVASFDNVWAISLAGQALWHAKIPIEIETRKTFSIPLPADKADSEELAPSLELAIELGGFVPSVTFLHAKPDEVVVASIQGGVYILDGGSGKTKTKWRVGKSYTKVGLRADGSPGAAHSDNTLSVLGDGETLTSFPSPEFPLGLEMIDDHVVLWRDKRVFVINTAGQIVVEIEFSKRVSSAAVFEDQIMVGAGILAAFSLKG